MKHQEAVELMASEKYLLDELTPELRDAYEDHFFGCTECALDVRLGAAFIDHAKQVLPVMKTVSTPFLQKARSAKAASTEAVKEKRNWFSWLQPAVMVPVFASLLAIIGYQNLFVLPSLELAANEPRVLPSPTILRDTTRSGHPVVAADRVFGSYLSIELPANTGYIAYRLDFYDSASKLLWSRTVSSASSVDDGLPLWLPGGMKQDTYKLAITGVAQNGENTPISQRIFDLQIKN